jgi:8-hydroxy-5-deazaflavin:NADPH oxidoreductase
LGWFLTLSTMRKLRAINVGPLERARQLEGLGFLGITLQQPLGLNFQSAWKLIS